MSKKKSKRGARGASPKSDPSASSKREVADRAEATPDTKPRARSAAEPAKQRLASGDALPVLSDAPRDVWIARAVIAAATLATFARGIGGPLLETWDDRRFLLEEEAVRHPSWSSLVSIFTETHFQAYHPLHLLSYWIDVPWLSGESAAELGPPIHAMNVLLWGLALWVVFELFRTLGLRLIPAVIATLLYGLHPAQVEAVTWATGRKEILAAALAAGSILLHLRSQGPWDGRAWGSRALFILAALAKTTALPLPAVILALDLIVRRRAIRDAVLAQLPAFAAALGLGVVVLEVWSANDMIRPSAEAGHALLIPATYTHHLLTALMPTSNAPLYPLARDLPPTAFDAILGPALLVGVGAWAFVEREQLVARRALFAVVAFLILLAPVSNVVPLYFQWQDRYLSLPILALAFGAGALVDAIPNARAGLAIGAAACAVFALRTVQYQGAWSSDVGLWQHTVSVQPDSYYAWVKLGEVQRDRGSYGAAVRAYSRAIEVAPELRLARGGLLSAIALRDEERLGITPSRGIAHAQRFTQVADQALPLRDLASEMIEEGYRDAAGYVLSWSLDLEPVPNERLERAAEVQLQQGNPWLARIYLSRISRRPVLPLVSAFYDREMAREAGEDPDEAAVIRIGSGRD